MKIILSRKGFDSAYGGYPSPILPDGRMISLPIPLNKECFDYKDLKLGNKTYYDLMHELGIKDVILEKTCHLDPDIRTHIKKRGKKWKPLFGQAGAAQGHLNKQNVKEGDLFLFFGTFKKTIRENKKLKFDPNDLEKHIIFGYLQIDKIIKSKEDIEDWMKYHSHCNSKRDWNKNNAIYVARRNLSWNNKLPGAGVFRYNKCLVLTANGKSKSYWDLPILKGKKISYHKDNSWKAGILKTVGRGQEFVIEDNKDVKNWAKSLVENNLL